MANDALGPGDVDVEVVPAALALAGPGATRDVFDAMGTARAMRYLEPDPVPRPLLDALVWAATRAPNPNNTQAWHFIVVEDRATLSAIAARVTPVMADRAE